ncbi:XrtN system VIT domain-containing protein [Chitinophaga sp.]|uniref:XrtN system VIT domain-containing protein n=1 Tax=Chitinophaga sp. TaxID=1869181 RepID=UPI0031DDDE1F
MTNTQYFQFMFRDVRLWVGLILIPVALGFYFGAGFALNGSGDSFGLFLANYVILQLYFIFLWATGGFKKGRRSRNSFAVYLTLCLISCFCLNREFEIFSVSTDWWAAILALCCINNIAYGFKEGFPPLVRTIMAFILGISTCCFLYLVFCLLPICVVGAIGGLFFGIGLHAFIPLLFLIYTYVLVSRYVWFRKIHRYAYLGGIGFVAVVLIAYTLLWNSAVFAVNQAYLMPDNTDLPAWENVARKAPKNAIVERVLKADLVYQTARTGGFGDMDPILGMPRRRSFFDAEQLHDPLIAVASLFRRSYVDETDAAKVLTAMYDSRQETQERLWSGDRLSTIQVRTNANIWPSLHMAYTEKTINVFNANVSSWRNQEAIYTFHLPEGGVVTSLSLWINGREEKGILTSKEKATEAYKQIVGVENRDPSVVHWQEGNTVTVRVFPVSGQSGRQFKIGITAPLLQQGKRLVYQNIWFQGPDAGSAREDVNINFQEAPAGVEIPGLFNRKQNTFFSVGPYDADWQLSCIDPGIRTNLFTANGKSFFVAPYKKELGEADVKTIYLDVNQSWTTAEFLQIKKLPYPVMVYAENEWQTVTDELFTRLQKDRYSLFPVYKVPDRASALVITKGNVMSPNLNDLAESKFYEDLKTSLHTGGKLLLFNLGGDLSPYLRTLKEYRFFRYADGDVKDLQQWLPLHQFPQDIENDHRVVIAPAGVTINMEENTGVSNAPDHLMRLFAYNHIMQKMGPQKMSDSEIIATAKESYIVTPASSLIVLETQKDYDRFNIHGDTNSLKNASLKGKGAVPEPHEWALILIGLGCILWFKKKRAVAI